MNGIGFLGSALIWLAAGLLLAVLAARARGRSIGLPISYLAALALIHVPGAMVYADGAYQWFDPVWVADGFRASAYGALAFAIGAVAVVALPAAAADDAPPARARGVAMVVRPAIVLVAGLLVWQVALPVAEGLPSVGALVAAGAHLLPAAFVLAAWRTGILAGRARLLPWLAVLSLMPLVTVGGQGFLGYGTTLAMVVVVAIVTLRRAWPWLLPALPVVVFAGLSLFVTYMRDRNEIRELVWGGASLDQRLSRIAGTLADFEWFDPADPGHRMQIDRRLNQNWMVGLAEERFREGQQVHANGETLAWSVIALVPRAAWPGKPEVGGGGDLVTRFTGVRFAEGTSVGAGQVLEFLVNFGTAGIWCCFLLFGAFIAWIDRRAAVALRAADPARFLQFALPGMAALQPGGNFAEVTTSIAAAAILGWLIARARLPWLGHGAGDTALRRIAHDA